MVWRFGDVHRLLKTLRLRHPEKTAKAEIALKLGFRPSADSRHAILSEWQALSHKIKIECQNYIDNARFEHDKEPDDAKQTQTSL